jgi:hypothetical protein
VTGLPQLDVPLVGYDFQRFEKAMRPAYQMVVKQLAVARELEAQGVPAPPPKIGQTVAVLSSREVAGGGREQAERSIKADNEMIALEKLAAMKKGASRRRTSHTGRQFVKYARVATGNETCAWCLMLVSRGPVYMFPDKAAGWQNRLNPDEFPFTETEVQAVYDAAVRAEKPMNELAEVMEKFLPDIEKRYHPGCDCMVVPVYVDDWFGRQDAKDAEILWGKATEGFKYDPEKEYRIEQLPDGSWKKITHMVEWKAKQRYALNRLRQHYAGKINLLA